MAKTSIGKTAIAGKGSYGRINKHIFKTAAKIPAQSRKAFRAYKQRKKLAGTARDYGIFLKFQPDVFLMNPLLDVRNALQKFMGMNLALVVRDRVVLDEIGPDGKKMGPFFNTGGMWRGFDVVQRKNSVNAEFYKSSYSAGFLLSVLKKDKNLTVKDIKKIHRDRRKKSLEGTKVAGLGKVQGYQQNVRNRDKAYSSLESKKVAGAARGREILEPMREEAEALQNYLEAILRLRTMVGDVSNIPRGIRKQRARRLIRALGEVKVPQLQR